MKKDTNAIDYTKGLLDGIKKGKKAGMKEVIDWIEGHTLIAPDENSITQFYPFYQIEEKELEDL